MRFIFCDHCGKMRIIEDFETVFNPNHVCECGCYLYWYKVMRSEDNSSLWSRSYFCFELFDVQTGQNPRELSESEIYASSYELQSKFPLLSDAILAEINASHSTYLRQLDSQQPTVITNHYTTGSLEDVSQQFAYSMRQFAGSMGTVTLTMEDYAKWSCRDYYEPENNIKLIPIDWDALEKE